MAFIGEYINCPVCNYANAGFGRQDSQKRAIYTSNIECNRCGTYSVEHYTQYSIKQAIINIIGEQNIYKFIGYTREQTLRNEIKEIKYDNLQFDLKNILIQAPVTVLDKMDRLLLNLSVISEHPGAEIFIDNEKDYPLGYCRNSKEFMHYYEYLTSTKRQYLLRDGNNFKLSVDGWDRIQVISQRPNISNQCFVAMWFNEEMNDIYDKYIKRAISDSGYKPQIVNKIPHDDDVNNKIIAEIRKSKFIIADFTGQRPGVYFEAGYAKGFDIPVVWSCREDWFDNEVEIEQDVIIEGAKTKGKIIEKRHTHFDVNHRPFILWKNPEDLYEKIKDYILAFFGEGPEEK